MKATLKNYRQAPRKVRLVANLIKGKPVAKAELELKNLAKRASLPMEKLLASAVANAVLAGADKAMLIVKEVRVDKGVVLKRMMPRAFGRGAPIHKHASHVMLVLSEVGQKAKKVAPVAESKSEKKTEKKAVKKTPAKPKTAKKTTK